MSKVIIVDRDAVGLCSDLNGYSAEHGLGLSFEAATDPEHMFASCVRSIPHLVLLHHHWNGIGIGQLLERIALNVAGTRVVVFTGQPVDVVELIECVRFGVADYWTQRGSLDPQVVCRKVSDYCSTEHSTVESLRRSSGSVAQLAKQAEATLKHVAALTADRDRLEGELVVASSADHAETKRIVRFVIQAAAVGALLLACFNSVRSRTDSSWAALAFTALLAVVILLLEGKLSRAFFRWRGGSAGVRG